MLFVYHIHGRASNISCWLPNAGEGESFKLNDPFWRTARFESLLSRRFKHGNTNRWGFLADQTCTFCKLCELIDFRVILRRALCNFSTIIILQRLHAVIALGRILDTAWKLTDIDSGSISQKCRMVDTFALTHSWSTILDLCFRIFIITILFATTAHPSKGFLMLFLSSLFFSRL